MGVQSHPVIIKKFHFTPSFLFSISRTCRRGFAPRRGATWCFPNVLPMDFHLLRSFFGILQNIYLTSLGIIDVTT